jgi:hypothetical protein
MSDTLVCSKCGMDTGIIKTGHEIIHICEDCIKPEDNVNHPKGYNNHPSGIECITIVRHMNYNLGNVVKYIWRCDLKGNPIEDLEKAAWYLNDEISKRKKLNLLNGTWKEGDN